MNCVKAFEMIQKEWKDLTFDANILVKDKVEFIGNVVAEKYFDDDVFVRCLFFKSGSIHVFFTFDRLEPTLDNLLRVNQFNMKNAWFKAYLVEKNDGRVFLELHFASSNCKNEKMIEEEFSFSMSELLSEDTMEFLKPLTEETYNEEN